MTDGDGRLPSGDHGRVADPDPVPDPPARPAGASSAGALLQTRLAEQVAELHRREEQVRHGDVVVGVHRARVACRRLRSALATFEPLLDSGSTRRVAHELRWLARRLGRVRDADVVDVRLLRLVEESDAPGSDLARHRLQEVHLHRRRLADDDLRRVLASPRHAALLASLDTVVADPPLAPTAAVAAGEVVPGLLARDWERVRRGVESILAGGPRSDPDELDRARHRVRKDAKRLRYAAETVSTAWPAATALAASMTRLTGHLGERQDIVMGRREVAALAALAEASGEPGEVWTTVLEREEQRARTLDAGLPRLWSEVVRDGAGGWWQPGITAPARPSSC
jgi:CHAD domain-containing protein